MNILKTIKNHPLMSWMIALIVVKTILIGGLIIYAISFNIHDDELMIEMASNLLKGQWLGPYDNRRLVKGITFPVYLALSNVFGIPYLTSLTILYGISCVVVTKAVQNIITHRGILALFFTIIYFIPASSCVQTTTRVYRNALLPTLTVLLFACLLQMYFYRGGNGCLFWSIWAGIVLTAFWNLREDSVWMFPTVSIACILTAIGAVTKNKEQKEKCLINFCSAFLPLLLLFGSNAAIKTVNNYYYGVSIRNELQEGGFSELMQAIHQIKPSEEIYQVSVPKSMIDQIYSVSPTFELLRNQLDANFGSGWDATDGVLDGQIRDGWFFWCLRDCISASGIASSAEETDAICRQMASEIKIALNDGTLSKREGIVMPSAIMSPWRPSFAVELPKETIKAFWYAARHEGCDLSIVESVGNDIDAFEMITRNFAVTDISEQELRLAGWVVSYDDKIDIELAVTRQDNQLIILDKRGGEDVYESFRNSGRVLENAHNCRFDQTVTCNNEEELWLCVLKNGKEIDRFPLNEETRHEERSNYTWYIDDISLTPREKSVLEIGANKRIVFLQWINRIYQRCGGIIAVIGLGCYFFLTLQLFARGLLKKNWQLFDSWLMCSSFLGSTIVLCVGIAYTQISSFTAISSVYLASGYILVTIFSVLSIIVIFREVKKSLNQKRQRKKKRFTYEDF